MKASESPDDALIVRAANGRRALDLGRDVHALLGLVFDRIDLAGATEHIQRCVATRRPCFLSTPNVNFVAAAAQERAFRDSVLRSDLSVADGFPIVLAARWMGIDWPGRVAGADLFERLQAAGRSPKRPPIKLYLFGGPPGVGAQAAAQLNARAQGFECVGHDEGGFGDIEAMSSEEAIARINSSDAEFVLVALGAKKGQAWIERNRARLKAPVVSHLGAVINFAAQSIERAPAWMQSTGLEWVWRIVQEPQLWRRYWSDGRMLVGTVLTRLLPWSGRRWVRMLPPGAAQAPQFSTNQVRADQAVISLSGDWRSDADQKPLRLTLAALLRRGSSVEFDLSEGPALDSTLLGLMALIDAWQVTPRAVHALSVTNRALRADVCAYGAQYLLGSNA